MKIFHCSDLHLGKRPNGNKKFSDTRYEDFFVAFDTLIQKIVQREVDILIIAGDFFDKKEINANILEKTESLLQQLKEQKPNLKIVAIEGNHDVIQQQEFSWLEYLKKKGYMEVYSYKKDYMENNFFELQGVHFYPVGYPGFMVDKTLEELAEKLSPEHKNIVIVHTGLSGSDTLPGLVSTKTLDLFRDKVIYMAAGHIHSFTTYPKEKPYFFIPGSLEYTNIPNEKSNRKGAIYFDTETREYEFVEITPRKRIKALLFEYEYDIEEEFKEYLKSLKLEGGELLLIPIQNKNREYINIQRLEELAIEQGALKVYFDIKSSTFKTIESFEDNSLQLEELEKSMIEEWDILRDSKKFAEQFITLKKLYLGEQTEEFMALFDKILEEDEL